MNHVGPPIPRFLGTHYPQHHGETSIRCRSRNAPCQHEPLPPHPVDADRWAAYRRDIVQRIEAVREMERAGEPWR